MRTGRRNAHPGATAAAALCRPVCVALIAACPAFAQIALRSLQGVVFDSQGAVVPHATVTVRNTDLGTSRTLVSAADGSFRVEGLPSGAYTVEARDGALATRKPLHLTLTLGSTQQLRLRLDPAVVQQSTRPMIWPH